MYTHFAEKNTKRKGLLRFYIVSYLALDDMHESWHQLWALQQEVEVVKDDFWSPDEDINEVNSVN